MLQGPVQAPGPHGASPADAPGLIDGAQRGPGDSIGEEELRIGVAAGGAVPPVLNLVLAGHRSALAVKAWLALAWVMARAPSLTSVHGGDIYVPPRLIRSRPGTPRPTHGHPRTRDWRPWPAAARSQPVIPAAARPGTGAGQPRDVRAGQCDHQRGSRRDRQLSLAGDTPSLIGTWSYQPQRGSPGGRSKRAT